MSHFYSRGSLSSIQGGRSDYPEEIDSEWERQVLLSSVSLLDSMDYLEEGFEELNLWGKYDRELCPHLKIGFSDIGCFRRKE